MINYNVQEYKKNVYIYNWITAVQCKLIQHCKSTILQLKKNKGRISGSISKKRICNWPIPEVIHKYFQVKRITALNNLKGLSLLTRSCFSLVRRCEVHYLVEDMAGMCVHVQSCPTLHDPMDCRPPDSAVYGILQARILEWVALSYARDLPDPGIQSMSSVFLHWQVDSLPLHHLGSPTGWWSPRNAWGRGCTAGKNLLSN